MSQPASEVEMTPWCNEHDLPLRTMTIRTGNDRIVCWFVWWVDAMNRGTPIEDRFPYDPPKPCIQSFRVVLAQGIMVVDKKVKI